MIFGASLLDEKVGDESSRSLIVIVASSDPIGGSAGLVATEPLGLPGRFQPPLDLAHLLVERYWRSAILVSNR